MLDPCITELDDTGGRYTGSCSGAASHRVVYLQLSLHRAIWESDLRRSDRFLISLSPSSVSGRGYRDI